MSLEYRFENRGTVQVRPTGSDKKSPCWYLLASVLLLLLIVGAWLFIRGYLSSADDTGSHALSLRGKIEEQEKLIDKHVASIMKLEAQLATVKREQQVQVAANEELGKKFNAAVADLASEREKLVLYEGILAPEDLAQGLHIQHFGIKPLMVDADGKKVERLYQYHLVLANIRGTDNTLEGSYSITISGKQDGKTVSVTLKDVTPPGEKTSTEFAVKHYQSLEGSFQFPKDFMPESVKLRVSPTTGETPARLTQSYDWAKFKDSNASTNKE